MTQKERIPQRTSWWTAFMLASVTMLLTLFSFVASDRYERAGLSPEYCADEAHLFDLHSFSTSRRISLWPPGLTCEYDDHDTGQHLSVPPPTSHVVAVVSSIVAAMITFATVRLIQHRRML